MNQNQPNPFRDHTEIEIQASGNTGMNKIELIIRDITGKLIMSIPVKISTGANRIELLNPGWMKGLYTYSLSVDGKIVSTEKMGVY
jgi:hypothetical protein